MKNLLLKNLTGSSSSHPPLRPLLFSSLAPSASLLRPERPPHSALLSSCCSMRARPPISSQLRQNLLCKPKPWSTSSTLLVTYVSGTLPLMSPWLTAYHTALMVRCLRVSPSADCSRLVASLLLHWTSQLWRAPPRMCRLTFPSWTSSSGFNCLICQKPFTSRGNHFSDRGIVIIKALFFSP